MDFNSGPDLAAVIPHKKTITSLSYHGDGVHLFAASEADSKLYLINTQTGKCDQPPFRCEREGITTVSSTHHDHCVLISGGKTPNAIHYWSLYDNKILRKFRGHADKITDISMNPAEDTFLTASKDRTVRLWNIQQAGCIGQMDLPTIGNNGGIGTQGQPHVVFDSTGLVFGVTAAMAGGQGNYIHLYDARNFTGGAFSELKVLNSDIQQAMTTQRISLPPPSAESSSTTTTTMGEWKSLSFNVSGNRMLVRTDHYGIVLDGYEGTVQRIFPTSTPGDTSKAMCFTPDDQSVLIGTQRGSIDCWNVASGTMVKQLLGSSSSALDSSSSSSSMGPITALACNPKYAQFASSSTSTCLWIW